ncbi:Rrf2 family transcriptional regulator [Aliidiomarina soli]|uniref:Transcriptional regulator n=1 Tax=Aliidiomarina soli TaxID=1928574 RepID=A0A432WJF7_9GAMM|nr:Rrf2 family transcriptional regulator [Aliidiomarina soli]RUO33940.1 transcriptional regulator [Aliidiomarina soli]
MQIKKYTDYGLRTLIYLATLPKGRLATINEICAAYEIPRNHLNKVIHQLGKEGFIITRRGKNGGFQLAAEPAEIRLDHVIRRLEGDTPWVNCHSPVCVIEPACELKHILAAGKRVFYDYLASYTLHSLLHKRNELEQIFSTREF